MALKSNRQFRQQADEKVVLGLINLSINMYIDSGKDATIKGTYFSTKQTRIINKLKLLR